jgi:hypothetical protein
MTAMPDAACPTCAQPGKEVGGQTVKSLLAVSLRQLTSSTYRFCATRTCPVVYFSESGQQFTRAQVLAPVYQKVPDVPNTPICYCFGYAVADLTGEVEHARIVQDIRAGIKAGQCACDLRNPQGTCCLGNLLAIEAEAPAAPAPERKTHMSAATLNTAIPVLLTLDVGKTVAFFTQQLGFSSPYHDSGFAILQRDGVTLHFTGCGEQHLVDWSSCRVAVSGVDALYADFAQTGAIHPNAPLESTDYGTREFGLLDVHGALITFFERLPETTSK